MIALKCEEVRREGVEKVYTVDVLLSVYKIWDQLKTANGVANSLGLLLLPQNGRKLVQLNLVAPRNSIASVLQSDAHSRRNFRW